MKKTLVGLVGMLTLGAAGLANANVIPDFTHSLSLGIIGAVTYQYEFDNGPKNGQANSFLDTISFTMFDAGNVQNLITETENIASGLKISLLDVTNLGNPVSIFDCSGGSCGTSQNFGTLIKNDNYQLTFLGTITGDSAKPGDSDDLGSLEGRLTVTAVPEASTLAMMFAGFALLGAYSRRRRSL